MLVLAYLKIHDPGGLGLKKKKNLTNSEFFGQAFNLIGGITTHRQEADEWCTDVSFLPRLLQVQDHWVCIPISHGVANVLTGLR